jgi:hypothetical protein
MIDSFSHRMRGVMAWTAEFPCSAVFRALVAVHRQFFQAGLRPISQLMFRDS